MSLLKTRGASVAFVDGDPRDADKSWAEIEALPSPITSLGSEIWLDDGERIRLPFKALPWILPDRSGVVVWFEDGEYTNPDGTNAFPKPNNAALYSADGSLRFQLRFPEGDHSARIGGTHSGSMPKPFEGMMGLVAGSTLGPPEWVYAIDPGSPVLIPTNHWVRW